MADNAACGWRAKIHGYYLSRQIKQNVLTLNALVHLLYNTVYTQCNSRERNSNLKGVYMYLRREGTRCYFFRKCWLEVKMRADRGLAQYAGKIFLHHFWKLKFCCSTLSTACLAATPILGFLSATRDPHLISPLLSRLPNILRCFYSTSAHTRTRTLVESTFSSRANRIRCSLPTNLGKFAHTLAIAKIE